MKITALILFLFKESLYSSFSFSTFEGGLSPMFSTLVVLLLITSTPLKPCAPLFVDVRGLGGACYLYLVAVPRPLPPAAGERDITMYLRAEVCRKLAAIQSSPSSPTFDMHTCISPLSSYI